MLRLSLQTEKSMKTGVVGVRVRRGAGAENEVTEAAVEERPRFIIG